METETEIEGGWPPWVEQWVLPYVRDSGLWPVLVALLGHVIVVIAPLMLSLYRGFLPSFLPLFFLTIFSGYCCFLDFQRRRRPGIVTALVGVVWALSAGLAWLAHTTGVY